MSHEKTKPIVEKLKAARLAKGISQRDLASLTGTLQSHISRIESNAVDLRLSSLLAVVHALDMDISFVPRRIVHETKSVAQPEQKENRTQLSVQKKFEQMRQTVYQLHTKNPNLEIFSRLGNCLTELVDLAADTPDIREAVEGLSRKIDQLNRSDDQIEIRAEILLKQLNWLKRRIIQKSFTSLP